MGRGRQVVDTKVAIGEVQGSLGSSFYAAAPMVLDPLLGTVVCSKF